MLSKYRYKHITWVDLESPSPSEIADVADEYALPRLVADELNTCTLRSKVDYYAKERLMYFVFHFPTAHGEQEIDFVIGQDFIVTARYEKIPRLDDFGRLFTRETFERGGAPEHAGSLFVLLMKDLYRNSLEQLENINDSLKTIEDNIFKGKLAATVKIISETNRKYLNFKQAFRHHDEILASFTRTSRELFGDNFVHAVSGLVSEFRRVQSTLELGREIINDLRTTNDSLLNTQTNETMKKLTTMTFILLPITLVTGVFGMSVTENAVLIKDSRDFILVLMLIGIVGLGTFIYFKGKRWL